MLLILLALAAMMSMSACRYRLFYDEMYVDSATGTGTGHARPPGNQEQDATGEPEVVEHAGLAAIEATVDPTSPLAMEFLQADALRYATARSDGREGADVGIEAREGASNNILTVETPTEIEGEAAIGDEGGIVGLIATYSAIFHQGLNTLFPCQQLSVYAETAEDFVAAGRGTDIYRLIADAGGANLTTRLSDERPIVTADWVVRRNPDVIVKFVHAGILGEGVDTTAHEAAARQELVGRPGWSAIQAVMHGRIILLSEEVLDSEEARLAAKLAIAHAMHPELFAGVDVGGTIARLLGGLDGIHIFVADMQ